jgi:hypothetical protein
MIRASANAPAEVERFPREERNMDKMNEIRKRLAELLAREASEPAAVLALILFLVTLAVWGATITELLER